MKALDSLTLPTEPAKRVDLLQGDLSDIPETFAVDLLVISCKPGDYSPTQSPLMAALYSKGLDVAELAAGKADDLRADFSCWLSKKIPSAHPGLRFSRLLCFEPEGSQGPAKRVGALFRALVPIIAQHPGLKRIALPITIAGEPGAKVNVMTRHLFDAAVQWLQHGLPVDAIRLVVAADADAQVAKGVFAHHKTKLEGSATTPIVAKPNSALTRRRQLIGTVRKNGPFQPRYGLSPAAPMQRDPVFIYQNRPKPSPLSRGGGWGPGAGPGQGFDRGPGLWPSPGFGGRRNFNAPISSPTTPVRPVGPGAGIPVRIGRPLTAQAPAREMKYDVFISYARENAPEVELLEAALRRARPGIRIFRDTNSIDIGRAWQPAIFENLDYCRKIVVIFSPDYLNSEVCKEEFNIAWMRDHEEKDTLLLFPIYLYGAALPTYMKYHVYMDCREGDPDKLDEASQKLLALIDKGA